MHLAECAYGEDDPGISRGKAFLWCPSSAFQELLERESTGVVSITNVYYLWRIETGHIFDLAYFIAFAFRYQTDHHRKGPIYLGPYVTHLARHFGLLNTPEQSSTLTLVGQMPPQDISSMIHIRMIELRRRVDPPQNRLFQSDVEHDPEDFTDDVPPYHEDPPQSLYSSHRSVHSAASSRGVYYEEFMSFRQYCSELFDRHDATSQQIC
ncbi:hypothetical protein F383_27746 [Gossypium arboreum]|uniref:Uncharacterized protein n=1 Tax=Gossypium arboreum TaxID=29729 RepID=A0A0B0MTA9_GOSAR|nr:hypothetical protein F383_27746 [Gossypium arboreum]